MVGSYKFGVLNVKKYLFENVYYIFVFNEIENNEVVIYLKKLFKFMLVKFIVIYVNEYDFVIGIVSYVLYIIVLILVYLSVNYVKDYFLIEKLVVGGFRDIICIVSSNV